MKLPWRKISQHLGGSLFSILEEAFKENTRTFFMSFKSLQATLKGILKDFVFSEFQVSCFREVFGGRRDKVSCNFWDILKISGNIERFRRLQRM